MVMVHNGTFSYPKQVVFMAKLYISSNLGKRFSLDIHENLNFCCKTIILSNFDKCNKKGAWMWLLGLNQDGKEQKKVILLTIAQARYNLNMVALIFCRNMFSFQGNIRLYPVILDWTVCFVHCCELFYLFILLMVTKKRRKLHP